MARATVLLLRPARTSKAAGGTRAGGAAVGGAHGPAATRAPTPASPLSRRSDQTLAEQLAQRYAELIRQRLLSGGSRLPSVRECARRHDVSPATVVSAYDRLLARGLLEARPNRGFFVRGGDEPTAAERRTLVRPAASRDRNRVPDSATALIRGMFQAPGGRPMPALGTLPAEWLDAPMLAAAMRKATSAKQTALTSLQYGDPAGEPRLRNVLAMRLADHGVTADAAQIVTTIGATHALDIVTRSLLRPGDSVLVDEPGWSVEYARLAALGMRVLPVPRGPDGPDLATMCRLIEAQRPTEKPRLYITVSVLHNPTGASLSLRAAHSVLQLAEAHDLHIVEDDTYAHLAPAHSPRLAALDGLARTIYISGFSKILTPNWRVGFMAAPASLVDRFVDTKLLSTLTTPGTGELALAHCLEQGWLRRHAERVRRRLEAARSRTARLAVAHGCRFVAEPHGLFGWVDTGVDTERLAHALIDDWLIAPGTLFHAVPRPTTLMRINFATSQDARFWKAMAAARTRL